MGSISWFQKKSDPTLLFYFFMFLSKHVSFLINVDGELTLYFSTDAKKQNKISLDGISVEREILRHYLREINSSVREKAKEIKVEHLLLSNIRNF